MGVRPSNWNHRRLLFLICCPVVSILFFVAAAAASPAGPPGLSFDDIVVEDFIAAGDSEPVGLFGNFKITSN
jgi:hypothetical protein